MQLKFISNACEIFISGEQKLLCDPWLSETAFEGSWMHWPPIRTTPKDVADYDYLYISHIDPDHFDPKTLEHFDKTKPVIILKFANDYLKKNLEALGFSNIHECIPEMTYYFGPFKLILFGPFQKTRLGSEAVVGNVIDSSLLIEADGIKVLNTVDNLPSCESAEKLQMKYGPFDLVQLNYNSAGPYPDCFIQYSREHRKFLADEFLVKQLNHFCDLACIFEGARMMPFAGDYVLVGKEWEKNFYNATCSPDYAVAFLENWFEERALKYLPPLVLSEGHTKDFLNPNLITIPFDMRNFKSDVDRLIYAEKNKDILYPHEKEEKQPTMEELELACTRAYEKLTKYRLKWGISTSTEVSIHTEHFHCHFSLAKEDFSGCNEDIPSQLECHLDPRLLWRLLHKKANWNNAEIGAHISFIRHPDIYEQDIHLLMNFFHV